LFFIGIVVSHLGSKEVNRINNIKRKEHFSIIDEQDIIINSKNQERWNHIKNLFHSHNPSDWKLAIIDADSLLDEVFTQYGFSGKTFGDKLKSATKETFPLLDEAWYVHKMRNNLAHKGSQFYLSERDSYQIFKIYENIFYSLGVISL
jgi:hypothetical protein